MSDNPKPHPEPVAELLATILRELQVIREVLEARL